MGAAEGGEGGSRKTGRRIAAPTRRYYRTNARPRSLRSMGLGWAAGWSLAAEGLVKCNVDPSRRHHHRQRTQRKGDVVAWRTGGSLHQRLSIWQSSGKGSLVYSINSHPSPTPFSILSCRQYLQWLDCVEWRSDAIPGWEIVGWGRNNLRGLIEMRCGSLDGVGELVGRGRKCLGGKLLRDSVPSVNQRWVRSGGAGGGLFALREGGRGRNGCRRRAWCLVEENRESSPTAGEIPYVRLPGNPVTQREVFVSSWMSASTHSLGSAISRGWQSGHRENDRRQRLPASPTALSQQL